MVKKLLYMRVYIYRQVDNSDLNMDTNYMDKIKLSVDSICAMNSRTH